MAEDRKAIEPNSHECIYYGRKLGNIICDDIKVSKGYLSIGSECDDEIYFNCTPPKHKKRKGKIVAKPPEMLKERVIITSMDDDGHYVEIDLEDVLRFAAEKCRGIYNRVGYEVEAYDCEEIELNHTQSTFRPIQTIGELANSSDLVRTHYANIDKRGVFKDDDNPDYGYAGLGLGGPIIEGGKGGGKE